MWAHLRTQFAFVKSVWISGRLFVPLSTRLFGVFTNCRRDTDFFIRDSCPIPLSEKAFSSLAVAGVFVPPRWGGCEVVRSGGAGAARAPFWGVGVGPRRGGRRGGARARPRGGLAVAAGGLCVRIYRGRKPSLGRSIDSSGRARRARAGGGPSRGVIKGWRGPQTWPRAPPYISHVTCPCPGDLWACCAARRWANEQRTCGAARSPPVPPRPTRPGPSTGCL
jgi:hypothetical protein